MPLHRTFVAETYPVASVELPKARAFADADAVVEALLRQIEEHPRARLIAVFDLLEHAWESGSPIPPNMRSIKQVIVCFGGAITSAEAIALRPQAISVVETTEGFAVNYMETRLQEVDEAMAAWLDALVAEAA